MCFSLVVRPGSGVAQDPAPDASNDDVLELRLEDLPDEPDANEEPDVDRPDADPDDLTLREVVVTGTRRETALADSPVQTQVLTRAEIESSGAETLAELLEEQAGIDVFSAVRGQGVRLRGLEPEHVLFLVDGERTLGRMDGTLDLTRWQLDDVERVEIVRGAASALYGSDALGGVIHVIPRRAASGWEGETRATYGYVDRRRDNRRDRFEGGPRVEGPVPRDGYAGTYDWNGRVGWGNERGGVSAFVGFHRLDRTDLDPRNAASNGPESTTWDVGLRGSLRVRRTNLRLRAEYQKRDDVSLESMGRAVLERLNRTEQGTISFGPEIRLRRGTLQLRGAYSHFRDQFLRRVRGGAQSGTATDTHEQLGQLQMRYLHAFSDAHVLTVGYDAFVESLDTPRLDRTGRRARLAPYVQHEWTPSETPRLSIVPGLRVDADSWFGAAVSPKLQMRFDPHERVVMRASAGRGFRAPDFRELLLSFTDNASLGYVVIGNPDLRAETSWSVDGGVELRFSDHVSLSATGYWTKVDDLITTDLVSETDGVSTYTYVNVDAARTRGVETQLRLTPLAGSRGPHRVRIDIGYAMLDADDLGRDRALPGRARHRVSFHARYEHRRAGLQLLWRSQLVGERTFYGDEGAVNAEPYLSIDLRAEKSLGDHVRVFVGADNVLNNAGLYLSAKPRTFWAGLAARL
ncbi:MAG: TonB-dependent receptor [Sandaracinus sp.]|nr:TonB-dependent receptor [Sandaracinus sp.]